MTKKELKEENEELKRIICDLLEDKTDWIIGIEKLGKGYDLPFKAKYYIEVWFNDMFSWAYSHAMTFATPNKNGIELMDKFNEWWNLAGIKFKERFDKVKYPSTDEKNGYNWDEVEKYFHENSIIGIDIEDSINNFCGFKLNDDFNRKELKEE